MAKVNRILEMLVDYGEKMVIGNKILTVLDVLGLEYEPFVTFVTT